MNGSNVGAFSSIELSLYPADGFQIETLMKSAEVVIGDADTILRDGNLKYQRSTETGRLI